MVVQRAQSLLGPPPGRSGKCAASNQTISPPHHFSHFALSADEGFASAEL